MRDLSFKRLRQVVKNRKGVAGLDVFLSIIAMLFMIGVLIMIFLLISAELQDTTTVAADATALNAINDTGAALDDAIDWFPIIIVLGAVVVLILLMVIVIRAIRGSGMLAGGA